MQKEPAFHLTDAEREFYSREGYLKIDRITTTDDVAKLRVSYDRIFAEQAGRAEGNQFDLAGTDEEGKTAALPQILEPAKYAPEMLDSQLFANATALARDLFGPAATVSIGHAILKPAGHGVATPWHQDAAYWPGDQDYENSISIWVPLQDTPVEMGCMQFVPRSHEDRKILRHQHLNNNPRIHGLELHESEMNHVKDVAICPLSAGGATVHGGYALHYTAPNESTGPRRALILVGGLPAMKRDVPLVHAWQEEDASTHSQKRKAQRSA